MLYLKMDTEQQVKDDAPDSRKQDLIPVPDTRREKQSGTRMARIRLLNWTVQQDEQT